MFFTLRKYDFPIKLFKVMNCNDHFFLPNLNHSLFLGIMLLMMKIISNILPHYIESILFRKFASTYMYETGLYFFLKLF